MRPLTNYSAELGDREPLSAIRDSMARIEALARDWSGPEFERTYAPGKWTARQVLTHLAHMELAFGVRVRMALASAGWFTAMTIQNAAYVRALGQIELVFTFAAAVFFFHERPTRTEVIGILLVIGGILLLLLH